MDVVVERAAALPPKGDLLLQRLVHLLKAVDASNGLLHGVGFGTVSHTSVQV